MDLSQSYFDEIVLENEDLFDLEPEDAVTETIDQLYKQQQQHANNDTPTTATTPTTTTVTSLKSWKYLQRQRGVSLTHPQSKQGLLDRERQKSMKDLLLAKEEWTNDVVNKILDLLLSLEEDTDEDSSNEQILPLGNLFWQQHGEEDDENQSQSNISKLTQFALMNDDSNLILALRLALKVLSSSSLSAAAPPKSLQRRSRQEQMLHDFVIPCNGWQRLFSQQQQQQQQQQQHLVAVECQKLWLQLVYQVCQGHEPNKKYCNNKSILQILVTTLEQSLQKEKEVCDKDILSLVEATCRLLTVLCRFDDFSSQATKGQATDNTGMVVSSSHSTVTTLSNTNLINVLYDWLIQLKNNDTKTESLLLALLQCLRSLAIQDDIITRMVATGLLEELQSILEHYCKVQDDNNNHHHNNLRLGILTALIGLYRNLSANDELKTILCRSPNRSIVGPLIATLQNLPKTTTSSAADATIIKLQEHVCATLGSMALRQPINAQRIVGDYHGHLVILQAMQSSPHSTLLQRQGALAIRNLASRAANATTTNDNDKDDTNIKQALLDAGAEPILRQAASLGGAVDEAYAALRDLNCPAILMKTNPDTGKLEPSTIMFGEKPLQFRPVYD